MMDNKRLPLAALFAATVIATLASCGGGGSSANPTNAGAPSPAPGAAPVPATGATASSCFEAIRPVVGNRGIVELEFQGPMTGTQRIESVWVSENATFEGNTGLYQGDGTTTGSTVVAGQTIPINFTSKLYSKVTSNGTIAFYGGVTKYADTTPTAGPKRIDTFKIVPNPPVIELRANMTEGTSQTYTRNSLTTITLADGTVTPPTSLTSIETEKYIGKETVTVPAGTFNACKFESTKDGSSGISSFWIYRNIVIKTLAPTTTDTQIMQLKSFAGDGAPL